MIRDAPDANGCVGAPPVGLKKPISFAWKCFKDRAWEPIEEHALRIATWNVNSVRQRLGHLIAYLKEASPDALCIFQELKCQDDAFPRAEIEELGYNVATHGQKAF